MKRKSMKSSDERGKIGYILGWLFGVPIPVLLLVYFLRSCGN